MIAQNWAVRCSGNARVQATVSYIAALPAFRPVITLLSHSSAIVGGRRFFVASAGSASGLTVQLSLRTQPGAFAHPIPQTIDGLSPVAHTDGRWRALDHLRLLAVLLMVQGHTFFVVLSDEVRQQNWYRFHSFVHGFTAPIFLTAAGLAFGLTTFRRWERFSVWGPQVWRRVERYVVLILLGYLLTAPKARLSVFLGLSPEELGRALRVDALHHIGVVLVLCVGLVLLVRSRRMLAAVVTALAAGSMLFAPWLARQDLLSLPVALSAYFTRSAGSLFPLLPWSTFIFAGIAAAHWVTDDRGRPRPQLPVALALAGALILLSSWLATKSGVNPFGEHEYWATSPFFVLIRLSVVLLILAAFSFAERWLARPQPSAQGASLARILSSETLTIYVLHLAILYGTPLTRSLRWRYGHSMSLLEAALTTALIFVACALAAYGLHRAKRQWPTNVARVQRVSAVGMLTYFLLT